MKFRKKPVAVPAMSAREFKYGLLKLAENASERQIARRLAAHYIDADHDAQLECSAWLRDDMAKLKRDLTRLADVHKAIQAFKP